jgi:hypothetical protein
MSQGLTGSAAVVPSLDELYNVTLSAPGDHEVLAYDNGSAEWINMTAAEAALAVANHSHADATTDAHGFMTDDQFDKLAGIEAGATAAGASHAGVFIPVIASPADNHFPYQTAAGILDDSTYDAASFIATIAAPADDHFPYQTAAGQLDDSGFTAADFAVDDHTHTEIFPFCMSGTLVTTTDTTAMRLQLPYAGTVVSACATVSTAPTGATEITVDVHKNGSTMYTSHAKPHIAASAYTSGWHAPDEAECAFSADDYFTVNVDAVGSTVAGANLTVLLRLTRSA